jgi:hypothetical protein
MRILGKFHDFSPFWDCGSVTQNPPMRQFRIFQLKYHSPLIIIMNMPKNEKKIIITIKKLD